LVIRIEVELLNQAKSQSNGGSPGGPNNDLRLQNPRLMSKQDEQYGGDSDDLGDIQVETHGRM
jgi:hypothetical protein